MNIGYLVGGFMVKRCTKRSKKGKYMFDTPKFRKITKHITNRSITRDQWDSIKEKMEKSNRDMVEKGILDKMPRWDDDEGD